MAFRRRPRHSRRANGFIVAFSLFVMLVLVSFVGSLLNRSATDLNVSERVRRQDQAFQIAEAGLDHALTVLASSSLQWDNELQGPDGLPNTSDDGILLLNGIPSDPPIAMPPGTYAVRVFDNEDDAPNPNDPTTDQDGIIRVVSTGTVQDSVRSIEVHLWSLFNHAIAADIDIILSETSALGNIHANRNIEVYAANTLLGTSQATATGTFLGGGSFVCSSCDMVGGDPPIKFNKPQVALLEAAVTKWNPNTWNAVVGLADGDIAGYRMGHDITPTTVSLSGKATLVVFDGYSLHFRDKVGPTAYNAVTKKYYCTDYLDLNIIAVGGGSITFDENACIRGLIWAEGSVTLGERSMITGAIVSAGGTVDMGEKSQVTFNRNVIESSLLPGFWGYTILSWEEL
jgi:hypothetical protein